MTMRDKEQTPTTITQLVESKKDDAGDSYNPVTATEIAEVSDVAGSKPNADTRTVELLDRLIAENMLVPGSDLSREIQDDYRRVKRPLVSNACGRDKSMVERGNIILVTSSIPGEGKTYTSINLALQDARS